MSQASKESIDMVLDAIGSQGAGAVDRADAALAKSRLAEPGGADESFFRFPRLTLTTSLHHMRCDECERWIPPATRCGAIAVSLERPGAVHGLICAACTDDECSAREQFYREWSAFTENELTHVDAIEPKPVTYADVKRAMEELGALPPPPRRIQVRRVHPHVCVQCFAKGPELPVIDGLLPLCAKHYSALEAALPTEAAEAFGLTPKPKTSPVTVVP